MSNVGEKNRFELVIRKAKSDDCEAISNLLSDSFNEFRELYTEAAYDATVISSDAVIKRLGEGPIWAATTHGKIVGTVSIVLEDREVYIRSMAVHPRVRGKRVGLEMLQTIEKHAMERGCNRLFLYTTPFLDTAIKLYKRFGFSIIEDEVDGFYETPLLMMSKSLTRS